jgi:hypothetical protein
MLTLKAAWADGTRQLVFEGLELLEKLAELTPRPRINLVLYHGVLAPHSGWRARVIASCTWGGAARTGVRSRGAGLLRRGPLSRHLFAIGLGLRAEEEIHLVDAVDRTVFRHAVGGVGDTSEGPVKVEDAHDLLADTHRGHTAPGHAASCSSSSSAGWRFDAGHVSAYWCDPFRSEVLDVREARRKEVLASS